MNPVPVVGRPRYSNAAVAVYLVIREKARRHNLGLRKEHTGKGDVSTLQRVTENIDIVAKQKKRKRRRKEQAGGSGIFPLQTNRGCDVYVSRLRFNPGGEAGKHTVKVS